MNVTLRSVFVALVSSAALACGASTPPPGAPHDGHGEHSAHCEHGHCEHGEHEHGEHGHERGDHPHLAGAAHEFHETLAPLWHAPKGTDREAKTCDAVPTLEQRAAAVAKEAPDGGAGAAQRLVAAVGDLKTECAKPAGGRADFDARFGAVHDAFHKVVEQAH